MIIFSLHLGILILMSWFVAQRTCQSVLDKVLAIFILVWANVVITALFLSCFSLFGDSVWYFRTSILISALTAFACRKVAPQRDAPVCDKRDEGSIKLTWLRRVLIGTFMVVFGLNLFICLKYSPNNWDSLTYHLPRIHFYLSQGHLGHFDTGNIRQVYFPFNATIFQAFLIRYGQSDKLLNLFNLASWIISLIALFALCRRCKLCRTTSLIVVWIGGMSGQVLAQATATTNDILAAAPFLVGVVFALDWWHSRRWTHILISGVALGLAFGTKLTMYFFGPAVVLICAILLFVHWRKYFSLPFGKRDLVQFLVALFLLLIIATPFLGINFFYTSKLTPDNHNHTINSPFSIKTSFQTMSTYFIASLVDPVQYLPLTADKIWKLRLELNSSLKKTISPWWDRNRAIEDLEVFGLSINEDGVFYGFSAWLVLIAIIFLIVRNPDQNAELPGYLAFIAIGWFVTYAGLSKWSWFNQRYFITAFLLCMPLVGHFYQSIFNQSIIWKRNVVWGLFGFVTITSILFCCTYFLYNPQRNVCAVKQPTFNRGKISISPEMELAQILHKKVKFVYSGFDHDNERLYQFMNRVKGQSFMVGKHRSVEWYNIYSFWGPTKNAMFSNETSSSAFTLISVPGKATMGVDKLGAFGDDNDRYYYFGIPELPVVRKSDVECGNILIRTIFNRVVPAGQLLEARLRSLQLEIIGLNSADALILRIYYSVDGEDYFLVETTHDQLMSISLPDTYSRLYFEVVRDKTGRIVAAGEMNVSLYGQTRVLQHGEIDIDLILDRDPSAAVVKGFAHPEGPYPQWDLPLVRWATSSHPSISFILSKLEVKRNPTFLSLSFRPQLRNNVRVELFFNKKPIKIYEMKDPYKWTDDTIAIYPKPGKNELLFKIEGMIEEAQLQHNMFLLFRQLSLQSEGQQK